MKVLFAATSSIERLPERSPRGIVDRHFAAENAHDVAATLATYTDDIVWDDVTHPLYPLGTGG